MERDQLRKELKIGALFLGAALAVIVGCSAAALS
jgi:hypothetical protein